MDLDDRGTRIRLGAAVGIVVLAVAVPIALGWPSSWEASGDA
jgi:hypothetical protein